VICPQVREAVTMFEELDPIARRVFGAAHPIASGIEGSLQVARASLRAREPVPGGGPRPLVGENDPCGTCGRSPQHTTFSRFVTTGVRRKTCDACKAKEYAQKAKKAAAPRPTAIVQPRAQPEQPVEVRGRGGPWRRFASAAAAATHYPGITAYEIEALVAGNGPGHLFIEARRATASPSARATAEAP